MHNKSNECLKNCRKSGKKFLRFKVHEELRLFNNYSLLVKEDDEMIKEEDFDDSFHVALSPIATFVQFLFLMPVCGISSEFSDNLIFKWMTVRVTMSLLYFSYGLFVTSLFFKEIFIKQINFGNSIGMLFFSYTSTCTLIFIDIAQKWPNIMKMWKKIDDNFTRHPYKIYNRKLSTKIRSIAIIIIILAVLEHFLFLANEAFNKYVDVRLKGIQVDKPVEYFLKIQFGFIYENLPFSVPIGFFNEIMNMTFTFGWNYMELFVMMISLGLSTRFQQINERISKFRGKIVSEKTWISVHKDYVSLCELVEKIDHDLRYLILLSNLNNVCFICFQLYHIFEKLPYTINLIYFWCSFLYLLGRTIITQFIASQIYSSSKCPIEIINSIPPEGWCIEMQRILDEARTQTIALSGMKFFYLTRKTILAMLATIVTYELVLWQITNTRKTLNTHVD